MLLLNAEPFECESPELCCGRLSCRKRRMNVDVLHTDQLHKFVGNRDGGPKKFVDIENHFGQRINGVRSVQCNWNALLFLKFKVSNPLVGYQPDC